MAALQATVVSGAVDRPPPHGAGHQPRRYPAAKLDLKRLKAGVVRVPDRQLLQVNGALRASLGEPFPTSEAIPRWQSHYSDFMGNGSTHEAWQAAYNRLISLCIQLNFDWQSSSCGCQTLPYKHRRLPSSLAAHEGQTLKYQHRGRTLPECRPIAEDGGAFCAL